MARFVYIAKRDITAGHSANAQYTIDDDLSDATPSYSERKQENQSVGGATHTIYESRTKEWQVKTAAAKGDADNGSWLEFLGSTAAGETFTFDPYGTTNLLQAVRVGDFSVERVGPRDWYAYSFRVRML